MISTATNTVTATIPVGELASGVAVNAAGTTAYVAEQGFNTVTAIDTATNATTEISGFPGAFGIVAFGAPPLAPAPAVTGVSPSRGPQAGGTAVTITGTGFTGATTMHFGTTAASSFTVNSDTQITATAPAAASPDSVDVTVTTPAGTSAASAADLYNYIARPAVTGVSPASGPAAGGNHGDQAGTGLSGATAVTFGPGSNAAGVSCNSAGTSCTAISPAEPAGTVDVQVTTPGGTSPVSTADQYTYVAPPAVVGVSPSHGPVAGGPR